MDEVSPSDTSPVAGQNNHTQRVIGEKRLFRGLRAFSLLLSHGNTENIGGVKGSNAPEGVLRFDRGQLRIFSCVPIR